LKFLNLNKNNSNKNSNVIVIDFFLYNFYLTNFDNYTPVYFFLKKNIKSRKIFLRKINNKDRNIKDDSNKRDKNINVSLKFFNASLKNGNKLNFLKN
jgi:hypothetical protein